MNIDIIYNGKKVHVTEKDIPNMKGKGQFIFNDIDKKTDKLKVTGDISVQDLVYKQNILHINDVNIPELVDKLYKKQHE